MKGVRRIPVCLPFVEMLSSEVSISINLLVYAQLVVISTLKTKDDRNAKLIIVANKRE